jgi:vancomycin resistance protein YoaR
MTRVTDPGREKPGGRVVLLLLLVLALLFGGAYAAAYAGAGDKVPRGTTVAGVEVGGMTPDDAVAALEKGLAARVDAPIDLMVDGETLSVSPADAGLAVDYEASIAAAGGGRSWAPDRLWDYYTGGDGLPPVLEIDEQALTDAVDQLAADAGTPARNGQVTFRDGRVDVTQPRTGQAVDVEAAREALTAAYLAEGSAPELTLESSQPPIDQSDVQQAVEEFANPAVSGPVTLLFGDSQVTLAPRVFSDALQLRPQDGELVPGLDRKALTTLLDSRISSGDPVDATVRIVNSAPRVIPAKPGVTYDPAEVERTFLDLVVRPEGKRQERIKAVAAKPDFTTADARALKIKEQVSTFTTYYPHAEYRNVNIGRAAELVDGTLLKPGETFSLNDTVGERTVENGFTEGYVISNGILVQDLGGGVSQMATTTFNAMFFAGLEDVEHKPHSFYIDRYPEGREATVAWGSVDLKFRNDTPYGVLISANVTPSTPSSSGVVTVSMWSTKYWDISTRTSERYNFTSPQTRQVDTVRCHPNEGYGGFDVDVYRYFRKPGSSELVRTEKFHTTYIPSDTVICTNPNATDS